MAFTTFPDGISVEDCEHIIKKYKDEALEAGIVQGRPGIKKDGTISTHRENKIHWINDNSIIVRSLFQFLLEANDTNFRYNVFNYVESSDRDVPQFTSYTEGEYYHWHQDTLDPSKPVTMSANRKLSLTVNLSNPESYEGGDLEFFCGDDTPLGIPRKQGSVICFDSFDWHRVTTITKGTRYSLVLWIWGPNFI